MESSTHQSYHNQNSQPNSSLLRFRSAPSSLLASFTETLDCGANRGGFGSEAAVNYVNSRQSYSGLPPHYPRQISSAIGSSYQLLGSDQPVTSSLRRQTGSPPGLFTNLSVQNGTGYEYGSWDDSADNFPGLKTTQNDNAGCVNVLSRHLSLPNTSNEMINMDKFLNFQDSVPCKIRAKRGCATHPRSIAERVRRSRISERMQKLQELVPNLDKQTNTADMLDLAVEYIKDLQEQFKILSDRRANCKCLNIQKPIS